MRSKSKPNMTQLFFSPSDVLWCCALCRLNATREQSPGEPHRHPAHKRLSSQPVRQQRGRVHVSVPPRPFISRPRSSPSQQPSVTVSCAPSERGSWLCWRPGGTRWDSSVLPHPLLPLSVSVLLPEVWTPAGVHLWPVWRLLPGSSHEQVSDGLHHTRSRTRYVKKHWDWDFDKPLKGSGCCC